MASISSKLEATMSLKSVEVDNETVSVPVPVEDSTMVSPASTSPEIKM